MSSLLLVDSFDFPIYFGEGNSDYGGEKTPWSESASELYRPSDRRLSEK
jgi:hypothetical protein